MLTDPMLINHDAPVLARMKYLLVHEVSILPDDIQKLVDDINSQLEACLGGLNEKATE